MGIQTAIKHRNEAQPYVSTTNACKLCMPLGACLAFKGVEGMVPFLHGSQGCATYMRRYLISHFREPVDIASSSLGEKQAIYGGGPNLKQGLVNVINKYQAGAVGVASTCLTETIGDDMPRLVAEFRREAQCSAGDLPPIVTVNTPSYGGTHSDGFRAAVMAIVDQLAVETGPRDGSVNLLPGMISPADTRYLREILDGFGLPAAILPDIGLTLDGVAQAVYQLVPEGGTPLDRIRAMGRAAATLEFGRAHTRGRTAGHVLEHRFGTPLHSLGLPIGIRESEAFFAALEELSGRPTPEKHAREKGRLLDALVDGHKYISGVRAVVYGEEDLVIGLTWFLSEIGVQVELAATGGKGQGFAPAVEEAARDLCPQPPQPLTRVDFHQIAEKTRELKPDLIIGNSKGYRLARETGIPLLRVGFPIHDRFGAQRVLTLGYRGAQELLDRIINAVLDRRQADSPVGYGYL